MKYVIRLAIIALVLFFSACAANLSINKYVEGNTFISERLPTVTIQVSSGYSLYNSNSRTRDLESDIGAHEFSGLRIFEAFFVNESDRNVRLIIKTEYTTEDRWYLEYANFKNWPGQKILLADQVINGKRFSTAIIQKMTDSGVVLIKYYSATYGLQSRITVTVLKRIPKRIFGDPPYSTEEEQLLSQFNNMADKSFEIVK